MSYTVGTAIINEGYLDQQGVPRDDYGTQYFSNAFVPLGNNRWFWFYFMDETVLDPSQTVFDWGAVIEATPAGFKQVGARFPITYPNPAPDGRIQFERSTAIQVGENRVVVVGQQVISGTFNFVAILFEITPGGYTWLSDCHWADLYSAFVYHRIFSFDDGATLLHYRSTQYYETGTSVGSNIAKLTITGDTISYDSAAHVAWTSPGDPSLVVGPNYFNFGALDAFQTPTHMVITGCYPVRNPAFIGHEDVFGIVAQSVPNWKSFDPATMTVVDDYVPDIGDARGSAAIGRGMATANGDRTFVSILAYPNLPVGYGNLAGGPYYGIQIGWLAYVDTDPTTGEISVVRKPGSQWPGCAEDAAYDTTGYTPWTDPSSIPQDPPGQTTDYPFLLMNVSPGVLAVAAVTEDSDLDDNNTNFWFWDIEAGRVLGWGIIKSGRVGVGPDQDNGDFYLFNETLGNGPMMLQVTDDNDLLVMVCEFYEPDNDTYTECTYLAQVRYDALNIEGQADISRVRFL